MSASRYAGSAQLSREDASGRLVLYLAPRILPQGPAVAGGGCTQVRGNEVHRLDLVAFRALGDAEQAWRIADANNAMNPFELCRRPGTVVDLPGGAL